MNTDQDRLADAAALWVARSRDPRFDQWEDLTGWLEKDPSHNEAYERALRGHDLAQALAWSAEQAVPPQAHRRRWPAWAGGIAVAASLVGVMFLSMHAQTISADRIVDTRPGEQRTLQLGDGTLVHLNGSTRLALEKTRSVRLIAGEALFEVAHDEERPFTVEISGQRLLDLGTRFDVVRAGGRSAVAVAEGAVLYDPAGAAIRLGPGRSLRKADDSNLVELASVAPDEVGTWLERRLVYRDATVGEVTEDVARLTGVSIDLSPGIGSRTFTGTFNVDQRKPKLVVERMARLLGLQFERRGTRWLLSSPAGARH